MNARRQRRRNSQALLLGLALALTLGASRVRAEDDAGADLRAAAEKGDAVAQFCLGNHYYLRRHRSADDEAQAQKWFRLAAAQDKTVKRLR